MKEYNSLERLMLPSADLLQFLIYPVSYPVLSLNVWHLYLKFFNSQDWNFKNIIFQLNKTNWLKTTLLVNSQIEALLFCHRFVAVDMQPHDITISFIHFSVVWYSTSSHSVVYYRFKLPHVLYLHRCSLRRNRGWCHKEERGYTTSHRKNNLNTLSLSIMPPPTALRRSRRQQGVVGAEKCSETDIAECERDENLRCFLLFLLEN
jgi:hypothetical protein